MPSTAGSGRTSLKTKLLPRILLALIILAVIVAGFLYREQLEVERLQHWIEQAGILAPLLFMVVYALVTLAFLPGVIMTLAGGALFGPVLGTFYNLTGATLGAALAFLLARYLAADWVERRTRGRARRLINGVEAEGWRFVAFVRLMPLFPFNLLNYLLGLTRIPFVQYLVATYLFMLPGAVAYTYLGYAGREAAAGGEDLVQKILLALGLLAVLAFLPRLVIRLRMGGSTTVPKLKERLEAGEDIRVLDVRTQADFESGTHGDILGAIHIPLEELAERLDEIATDSDRPLAILCLEDRRAIRAAKLLAGRGFSNARVVRKGATAWNDGGWPVFKASPSTEAGS